MPTPAVFLDRDNTLIEDPGFIDRPEQVKLLPGAAEALHRMRAGGYKIVIVSNQSGVARGLFDESQLARVHERLRELLADEGVAVDAIYACPYLEGDEAVVEEYRRDSDWRKPKPGMLLEAARECDIDLSRSWMIGDRASDVEAGAAARCRTILVSPNGSVYHGRVRPDHVADSLLEAARIVEQHPGPSKKPRPESAEETTLGLLGEIRDTLQRRQRRESQDDFSLVRLVGSLMQMLAIVVALWSVVALFAGRDSPAIARMGLAIFLQMLAITIYIVYRRR